MILFPFVDHGLQQASDLDRVIAMNATEEQIRATPDVNLIFLRPSDPAMILVGFFFSSFGFFDGSGDVLFLVNFGIVT